MPNNYSVKSQPVAPVGRNVGGEYSFNNTVPAGVYITTLKVWYREGESIKGIQLVYSNGQVVSPGTCSDDGNSSTTITFQANETVSQITTYTSDYGNGAVIGIAITKAVGSDPVLLGERTSDPSYIVTNTFASAQPAGQLGSQLLGIYGFSGSNFDALGFYFGTKALNYKWINVNYDTSNMLAPAKPSSLGKFTLENGDTTPQSFNVGLQYAVTNTSSYESINTLAVGVTASGEAGVPFLAKGKWSVRTDFTHTWQTGGSVTEAFTFSENVTPTIAAGHKLVVDVFSHTGTYTVPYTAQLLINYVDGTSSIVNDSGTCTGNAACNLTLKEHAQIPLGPHETKALGGKTHVRPHDGLLSDNPGLTLTPDKKSLTQQSKGVHNLVHPRPATAITANNSETKHLETKAQNGKTVKGVTMFQSGSSGVAVAPKLPASSPLPRAKL